MTEATSRYVVEEGDQRLGWKRWVLVDTHTGRRIQTLSRWEARQCAGWASESDRVAEMIFGP